MALSKATGCLHATGIKGHRLSSRHRLHEHAALLPPGCLSLGCAAQCLGLCWLPLVHRRRGDGVGVGAVTPSPEPAAPWSSQP